MFRSEGPKANSVTIYLFACFSRADGPQCDMKMRVGEGLRTFGDINKLYDIRS